MMQSILAVGAALLVLSTTAPVSAAAVENEPKLGPDDGSDSTRRQTRKALKARVAALEAQLARLLAVSETQSTTPMELRLALLESRSAAHEESVAELESKTRCLSADETNSYFTGCNLHVRNGTDHTDGAVNALGNLIVGYNEALIPGSRRSGSHNLVIGGEHSYTSYGGLIAGFFNAVDAPNATVIGGAFNRAAAARSTVQGGEHNETRGLASVIVGGRDHTSGRAHSVVTNRVPIVAGRVPDENEETGKLLKNDAVGWCSDRNGAVVTSLQACARNADCGSSDLALCDKIPPARLILGREGARKADARAAEAVARGPNYEHSGRYLSPFTTSERAFNRGALSPFAKE